MGDPEIAAGHERRGGRGSGTEDRRPTGSRTTVRVRARFHARRNGAHDAAHIGVRHLHLTAAADECVSGCRQCRGVIDVPAAFNGEGDESVLQRHRQREPDVVWMGVEESFEFIGSEFEPVVLTGLHAEFREGGAVGSGDFECAIGEPSTAAQILTC